MTNLTDTFKPSSTIISNRSIITDNLNTNAIANLTEFMKNLEEEIYSKFEVEANLLNLSKEKSTFLNLIQNHQDKLDEKILSLSNINKNISNISSEEVSNM